MFKVISPKSGKTFYLHTKEVQLRSGIRQRIFYFSMDSKGALEKMPSGYEVIIMERTGMPLLKKIR